MSDGITPSRVLLTKGGHAMPGWLARQRGMKWDITFTRADGWSIAVQTKLEKTAFELWPDEWVSFQREGQPSQPIYEYKHPGEQEDVP